MDPRQKLVKLANNLDRKIFEEAFAEHYSSMERPAKPVRLMVGLLLLKRLPLMKAQSAVGLREEGMVPLERPTPAHGSQV